ncbi:MAG: hypothetical protein KF738_15570 [Burkholderiales bacterium]|nr:hypothetical protein [Burkholderiales bacterium]
MRELIDVANFGSTDADTDDLLEQAFQGHEAYIEAVAHRKPLVVGRKGSGKTAIFRKIIRMRQHDVFAYGHTFTDYPWHHHNLQGMVGVPEEQRFAHSWRYLILMTLAKILLNQDSSQPWNEEALEELGKVERFVVDSYGTRDPDVTQLFTPGKRLRIKPHLRLAGIVEAGVDLESVPVGDLPKIFQEVNNSIADAIAACLNPAHSYYVCFDELDKGFDPNDARYSQMLVGLLLAANSLNNSFRQANRRTSIVLCLRDDIYRTLQFEDKNKLTENFMSLIEWDGPRTRWTLRSLLERRFAVALQTEELVVPWENVFDEAHEMPGRQSKYKHILDRTFRRPRDAIKFANEVLVAYKAHGGTVDGKFENRDIITARTPYSEYLLNELADEIFKHVPEYRDYIDILRSLEALQFTREEFDQACMRRSDLLGGATALSVLRQLFEFSLVGYQKTGGVGGGSEYIWRYIDPTVRLDEAATSFRIHAGLMEALGLKKFRRGDAPLEPADV